MHVLNNCDSNSQLNQRALPNREMYLNLVVLSSSKTKSYATLLSLSTVSVRNTQRASQSLFRFGRGWWSRKGPRVLCLLRLGVGYFFSPPA